MESTGRPVLRDSDIIVDNIYMPNILAQNKLLTNKLLTLVLFNACQSASVLYIDYPINNSDSKLLIDSRFGTSRHNRSIKRPNYMTVDPAESIEIMATQALKMQEDRTSHELTIL